MMLLTGGGGIFTLQ